MQAKVFLIAGYTLFGLLQLSFGSDLHIGEVTLYREAGHTYALLEVHWKYAWHDERNHDGVWLFLKASSEEDRWRHVGLASAGHRIVDQPGVYPAPLTIEVTEDGAGIFVYPSEEFRGSVHAVISLRLAPDQSVGALRAYGLEMVYIPEGPNTLGDPDTSALTDGAFYRIGESGGYAGQWTIESETEEIPVGSGEGALSYRSDTAGCHGDGRGPVPAAFPKGVAPFWIMKYELNEGQYATFLNALTPGQARRRTPLNTKGYQEFHGSITYTEGGWAALHPGRPAGFLSWRDLLAYADWAALRPMTELEYTKACRGAREPVPGGYAWGSDSRRGVRRGLDENGFLVSNGLREDDLSTDGNALAFFGASYYRVLELSGSLWEWTVSIGHPEGRDFTGEPGDGQLSPAGEADAPGWPLEQGFGFRGSFYHTGNDPLDLRTYTPVAERPFAGLSDKTRRRWYGGRLVR